MHINHISGQPRCIAAEGAALSQEVRPAARQDCSDPLLSEPLQGMINSGDPMAMIGALMTLAFRQDRKNASQCALLEERNIMAEGKKGVQAMRDKADAIRSEAYVRGSTQIISGAVDVRGGLEQSCADRPAQAATTGRKGTSGEPVEASAQPGPDVGDASVEALQPTSAATGSGTASAQSVFAGSAKLIGGLGEIAAGGYKAAQQEADAAGTEHEALSEAAKRRAEEYRDQVRDAREMLAKIADFLREAQGAQNDASKAAIYRA